MQGIYQHSRKSKCNFLFYKKTNRTDKSYRKSNKNGNVKKVNAIHSLLDKVNIIEEIRNAVKLLKILVKKHKIKITFQW